MKIIDFRPSGDHEWVSAGMCSRPDAPNMFPHSQNTAGIEAARETCLYCPVRLACLTDALSRGERFGVWGGLTSDERSSMRRKADRRARETGMPRLTVNELATACILADDDMDVAA